MSETKRIVIYLTSEEYEELSDAYRDSELVGTRDTYGSNHTFGEFIRQCMQTEPEVDLSGYSESRPSVRYNEKVTVEFPGNQYANLKNHFDSTPVAEDRNGRYALSGNSPFSEYLRRCLSQQLDLR